MMRKSGIESDIVASLTVPTPGYTIISIKSLYIYVRSIPQLLCESRENFYVFFEYSAVLVITGDFWSVLAVYLAF